MSQLFNIKAAAETLRTSPRSTLRIIAERRIAYVKVGHQVPVPIRPRDLHRRGPPRL